MEPCQELQGDLRAARDGSNPAYSGCEVQILDDFNWETRTNSTLQPYQFTGGLYGAHPPGVKNALRPLGEWNTYQIHYAGSRIQTVLNGHVLYDVDTHTLEGAKPPFAERGFMQRSISGALLISTLPASRSKAACCSASPWRRGRA